MLPAGGGRDGADVFLVVVTLSLSVFQGEASRYIFLNKFRKFLQENASNRGVRRTHLTTE